MLLFFSWRGAALKIEWPAESAQPLRLERPADLQLAGDVQKIAARMTPKDRAYMAHFYDALGWVLNRDGERDKSIITDTNKFEMFHSQSLDMAIDRKDVGKYDGLGAAIDQTFISSAGADSQNVTPAVREKLLKACSVLAWTFQIHGE